jgi:hypothetical protein
MLHILFLFVLLSSDTLSFMPLDGLADVAEYTAKALTGLV